MITRKQLRAYKKDELINLIMTFAFFMEGLSIDVENNI